jgi:FtsZ-interacting cell division protein ZipA
MSTITIVVGVLVVLAIVGAGFVLARVVRERRSRELRATFGAEYERAIEDTGDQRAAEDELEQRIDRHHKLDVRELDPRARARYGEEWRAVQSRFVDDPRGAVREADDLVQRVMRDRGYPTEDFDQQVADVSVDHAEAVPSYRSAHAVLLSNASGAVATDDLRQAMVHYRDLFADLVGEAGEAQAQAQAHVDATREPAGDEEPAQQVRREVR